MCLQNLDYEYSQKPIKNLQVQELILCSLIGKLSGRADQQLLVQNGQAYERLMSI